MEYIISYLISILATLSTQANGFLKKKALEKACQVVHREVKKGIQRALFSALQNIILECHKQLYPHKFMGILPIYPQQHRNDLKWLDQKRDQLAKALKQLQQDKPIDNALLFLNDFASGRNSTDLAPTTDLDLVKEKLIAELLKEEEIPECYAKKVKTHLFDQVCDQFQWEINYNPHVHDFIIQANLTQLTTQKDNVTVIVTLDVELHNLNTPQLFGIVEELRRHGMEVSLKIRRVESGSVKLVLEASQKGGKQLQELFQSGQLTEILGISIKALSLEPILRHKNYPVDLSQWLQNHFSNAIDAGWQMLEDIFAQPIPAFKATVAIKRAKQIHLGESHSVILVVEVNEPENQEISIILRVYPLDDTYLPDNLKLTLLSESAEPLETILAGIHNDCLEQPLSGIAGEAFSVNLMLRENSVTEYFVI
ncbi:MAG: hypothetical protein DRR16_26475 [Candidatus Parabeggiatoa sp. nov. 3]|nr:MAG: hypothetical protein DRR00_26810 [Gammaproteobacteria bacterium]RKZ57723.1 MAG: hypothetical protein DRQ99_26480 [Gammaproteobacteria bacterium]RKZ79065.1 MAG: hypothetical protein DRR16_26475 [Gammaproteobacteria bacterium]